jgi:hypothetical protein
MGGTVGSKTPNVTSAIRAAQEQGIGIGNTRMTLTPQVPGSRLTLANYVREVNGDADAGIAQVVAVSMLMRTFSFITVVPRYLLVVYWGSIQMRL